ncbi:MAG TPA: chorismate mutase [Chitinophagaceae bacterium]|jgi:chorismate mutase|nr:chorismate mutase [Chitinophagaceae bacterium]
MRIKIFFIVPIIMACISNIHAQTQTTDSLLIFRRQIDSLDKQLIEILGKRMQVVANVGKYKAKHNIAALQQSRFDAILQKNIAMGKAFNLSATLVTEVMNAIHKESLSKEHAVGAPEAAGKQ